MPRFVYDSTDSQIMITGKLFLEALSYKKNRLYIETAASYSDEIPAGKIQYSIKTTDGVIE